MKYIILLLCLLAGNVQAQSKTYSEWATEDKAQFATYTALAVMDYKQTSWAMKQKDSEGNFIYQESNPFLGNRPSDTKIAVAQLASVGLMYYDIKHYGEEHRKIRWALIVLKTAVVVHNNNLGVTFNKVW